MTNLPNPELAHIITLARQLVEVTDWAEDTYKRVSLCNTEHGIKRASMEYNLASVAQIDAFLELLHAFVSYGKKKEAEGTKHE